MDAATNPNVKHVQKIINGLVEVGVNRARTAQGEKITTLEGDLATERAARVKAESTLTQRSVADEIRAAARANHVKPEAVDDLITLGNLELTLKDNAVTTEDGRDVQSWIEDRKAKSPWLWPPAVGSGSRGSFDGNAIPYTGDNPFQPGANFNLTKQGEMLRTNPTLAQQLQANAKH